MKRLGLLWGLLLTITLMVRGDGLIVVHDPGLIVPPPRPWPRPPWPRPVPPPRPYTFAPLEVMYHRVDVKVRDQVAVTSVDQEFHNPNDRTLEGTYVFPVPKGAQIDKFSMDIDGRSVDAELLAADKARKIYEDIVRQHRDPALLEYAGREMFKVRIYPIEPRSKKRVKLSYTQVLKSDAGLVQYLYPLNTERFSAKPISSVSLRLDLETRRPLKTIYSPSHAVEIRRDGERRAIVGFETKDVKPDTDFQLLYGAEGGAVGMSLVTHRVAGEDGFFMLLAAPSPAVESAEALPKDVTFVVDTSGSMADNKLEQARKALLFCVENLGEQDRFQVIRFSTEAEPLFDGLIEANAASRQRAAVFIRGLKPLGGTAIHDALERAVGARPDQSSRPYYVIFLTDGLPTVGEVNPDAIVRMVEQRAGGKVRGFCFGIGHDVNTHLLDRITETTRGTSAYVLPDEDLEVKLSSFFSKIKEPILAQLKLTLPEAVRATALYPAPLPDLFRGDQLVVVGRYSGRGEGPLTIEGNVNGRPQRFSHDAVFVEVATEHDFIPRLWAVRRIGYLLDEIRLRGENSELKDEIVTLARGYGVVTPYTAFLIQEDEQRRGVPLAQQMVPASASDPATRRVAADAFRNTARQSSGAGAVAAARYGLSQKTASRVDDALATGRQEAERMWMAAAPAPVATSPAQAQPAPWGAPSTPGAASTTAGASGESVRWAEYGQQTRFVNGRSFFQSGEQWIDARVPQAAQARRVRIQFNSSEYFDWLARHPEAGGWLALGSQVQFLLDDTIYEIHE